MHRILIFITLILVSTVSLSAQQKQITSISLIKKKEIDIYHDFTFSNKTTYQRLKSKRGKRRKSYFIYEGLKVFIDVDTVAVPKINIIETLAQDWKMPTINNSLLPIAKLVFIIDSNGYILNKGLLHPTLLDEYNELILQKMNKLNFGFTPAMVDGKSVSSLFILTVNFHDELFFK